MITSNLDIVIAIILIFFSACGLIRGFLKETSSVCNWFGSFYLTSIIKPLIKPLFEDKIQIQFLLDTIVNIVVFIALVVILSIITNYLTIIFKKIIPSNINGSLGLIFGFIKGFLISSLIIAFIKIIYNKSDDNPEWLKTSYVYNSVSYDGNFFINILNNLFGSYIKEERGGDNEKVFLNNRFNNILNEEEILNKTDIVDSIDLNIDSNITNKVEDIIEIIEDNKESIVIKDKNINEKNLERLINIVIE